MSKYENILTFEVLKEYVDKRMSLEEIAKFTNSSINAVFRFLKKFNLKTNPDIKYWNKGLTKNDSRVDKSTKAARKSREGKPAWNKGVKVKRKPNSRSRSDKGIGKYDHILTKEFLLQQREQGKSYLTVSKETGINRRTVCNYCYKYDIKLISKDPRPPQWNKGLKVEDDIRIQNSINTMKKANQGKIPWNKGLTKQADKRLAESGKKASKTKTGKPRHDLRGKNHPNWKGGSTRECLLIRSRVEYKQWRKLVFERDNYICQTCFKRGGYLEAHHIKKFADFPELRFDINNGITLCEKCHRKTPNYGNKKDKINDLV